MWGNRIKKLGEIIECHESTKNIICDPKHWEILPHIDDSDEKFSQKQNMKLEVAFWTIREMMKRQCLKEPPSQELLKILSEEIDKISSLYETNFYQV